MSDNNNTELIAKLWDITSNVEKRHKSLRDGTLIHTIWMREDGYRIDVQYCPNNQIEYSYAVRHCDTLKDAIFLLENGFNEDELHIVDTESRND